jgi:hypothetical protein
VAPSPLLRFAREDAPVADPASARQAPSGMIAPPFSTLGAWLVEVDRQAALMRPRRQLYARFDQTARTLTAGRIRQADDMAAIATLVGRLRGARHSRGQALYDLDRVWSRAELGVLISEAEGRRRQLAMGRVLPQPKGPHLDPRRLPDDRLEHHIQHHRDLQVVEALRVERRRRAGAGGDDAA